MFLIYYMRSDVGKKFEFLSTQYRVTRQEKFSFIENRSNINTMKTGDCYDNIQSRGH